MSKEAEWKINRKIVLPEKVKLIIRTIQAAGFEAYAVGGCIRDSVLGREPNDWDITTSARPEEVKALFRRTVDTGIKHGTVTVMLDKEGFEVTTYRIDGEYEDGRHPKDVQFTASLTEDLKRRDFTINAMAYNDKDGLVDVFDGIGDLQRGIIRCVGDPRERFTEDALRMLRAIRFSAQLGYTIEEGTKAAIKELSPTLNRISAERIQVELIKLLLSPHPDYLRIAYDTGVTKVFFPEWDKTMVTPQNHPHHCYNVGEHILHSLLEVPSDKVLRLAMLLHDIAKPETLEIDDTGVTHFHGHEIKGEEMSRKIMRRLRLDNDTIHKVCTLVLYHDYGNGVAPDCRIVRRAVNKIGEDLFPSLLLVRKADIMAQSDYQREEKLANLEAWRQCYENILKSGECVSLKTLAISGKDLIEAGIAPGKRMGEILDGLLQEVLEDPSKNTREYLLSQALK
ncbi:MAG: CCA tRNA nucleotidyltransferase [Lachnospiraceae bacterium]